MWKSLIFKSLAGALLLALAMGVTVIFAAGSKPLAALQDSVTSTPQPTPRMPGKIGTGDDWIIFDLPKNAPQIDYGQEIYRLVCSACHGDVGQGLTPEWRSTWAPEDQNCWQSKCHGPNHPPEGFTFPVAPAINNLTQRTTFPTALQLQAYIHAAMPWYKPGGLTDERAWQVTAYVLKLNQINAGPVLNADSAAKIRLAPESAVVSLESAAASSVNAATQDSTAPSSSNAAWLFIAGFFAAILMLAGGIFLWHRARR